MSNTWLLSPDDGPPGPNEGVFHCPTCGRVGVAPKAMEVVCYGGRPADHLPVNTFAVDFMPPHHRTVCRAA